MNYNYNGNNYNNNYRGRMANQQPQHQQAQQPQRQQAQQTQRQQTEQYQTNRSYAAQNNGTPTSFDNNPKLQGVDPVKLKVIMEIKEQSRHKSMEELLPEIMKINQELNRRNMNFTKTETALLMDAIEESLSPAEKQKFNMLKGFMS